MIRNILFDLDNTLLDFNTGEKNALTKTLKHFGKSPDKRMLERYSEINLYHWQLMEQGKLTREQVKVDRYRTFFREFGIDASPEKATEFYESMLPYEHSLVEGAYSILENLSRKYHLYVVSNGTLSVQKKRMEDAEITGFFKDFFISQEIGFEKPSAKFFDYCFSKIPDFKKNETIIVGDSVSADIAGGINAGIKAVWFNPDCKKSDISADYEIYKLSMLEQIL